MVVIPNEIFSVKNVFMQGRNKRTKSKKPSVDAAMFGVVTAATAINMRRFHTCTSCKDGLADSNLQGYDAFQAISNCR
jgi:hypothetical protein